MVHLVRITYALRGVYHTATTTHGEAVIIADVLRRAYPGLVLEQVDVVG